MFIELKVLVGAPGPSPEIVTKMVNIKDIVFWDGKAVIPQGLQQQCPPDNACRVAVGSERPYTVLESYERLCARIASLQVQLARLDGSVLGTSKSAYQGKIVDGMGPILA